jgi:hypothetical protein
MSDPSQIPEYIDRIPVSGDVWTQLESQLSEFHDVLFYTRPETLEEAIGEKSSRGKYVSSAPKVEEFEATSRTIHEGVIPYSSQDDIDFLEFALPSTQQHFYRARNLVDRKQLTSELLILWGQLSYYCGRIESYWTLSPEKISHHRGGKSNKDINSIQAQRVWYSKMIKVAKATLSTRKRIDLAIRDEIKFRRMQEDAGEGVFGDEWYGKFFNAKGDPTAAFTGTKLYGKLIDEFAANPENLPIPVDRFLSTPAIVGTEEGT